MATTTIASVKVFWSVCSKRDGWRVLVVNDDQSSTWSWSDAGSLIDAIQEAIDLYDLPACRDDFGVCQREGWAIWERAENGYKPTLTTKDGLTVYDLDPQSSELWAVAGPAGFSKSDIDTDNLPEGFRWVTAEEWQELVSDDA